MLCQQHPEFTFMLKDKLSPLVIKLFSPSLKYRQAAPLPPSSSSSSRTTSLEKPFFPVVVRLLRIVGILIQSFHSILVRSHFRLWCLFVLSVCIFFNLIILVDGCKCSLYSFWVWSSEWVLKLLGLWPPELISTPCLLSALFDVS